jgi:Uma2 family endonuclease
MTYTPSKLFTFEQFIAEYGDNPRYELIDGELRDMEKLKLKIDEIMPVSFV